MNVNLEEKNLNLGKNLDFQRLKLKLFFAVTLLVLTGSLVLVVSILSGGSRLNALFILIGCGIFYAYETNKELKKLTSNLSLEHPDIMEMVRKLSEKGGIPVPGVLTENNLEINASALWTPKKSYIFLPKGIIQSFDSGTLTKEEMESILAHEIGHIIDKDSLINTYLLSILEALNIIRKVIGKCGKYIERVTNKSDELRTRYADNDFVSNSLLAFTLLLMIVLITVSISSISLSVLIIICVYFINLLSRQMEYVADLISARLTQNPLALAEALHKITKIDLLEYPEAKISLYQSHILNKKTTDLKDIKPSFKERLSEYNSDHPNLTNRIDMLLNPKDYPKNLLAVSNKLNLLNLKSLQLKELPVINILNWKIPLSDPLYNGILVGLFLGIISMMVNYFTLGSFIDYIVFILGALWIGFFSLSRLYPEGSSISTSSFDTMMKVIFVVSLTYSIITTITIGVVSYYSTILLGITLMAPVSLLTEVILTYLKESGTMKL